MNPSQAEIPNSARQPFELPVYRMSSTPDREVHIRPMTVDDLAQVKAIDNLSFSLPWPENAYRYELTKNPASRLWVAELRPEEGKPRVVGMIVVWLVVDEAHIATLAVHPDYRELKIGSSLLGVALAESIRAGARQAMLEVRDRNLVAQSLYRRFGFEIVGRRPRYYRDNGEDALLMNLRGLDGNYLSWLESQALADT